MNVVLFALTLLTTSINTAPPPVQSAAELQTLRELFLRAVEDETVIDPALELVEEIRDGDGPGVDSSTLLAYEGALTSLRAKHGVWPHRRLHHLQAGLSRLDDAVATAPGNVEARYLRLLTCYYLPGIFGRDYTVRADFEALGILLPSARGLFPPDLFRTMTGFVIEEGDLPAARQRELELSLSFAGE